MNITSKYINFDDELLLLDMEKIGLKKNPVLIMSSIKEFRHCLEIFKNNNKYNNNILFKNIVKTLGENYNNLDEIYKYKDGKYKNNWDNFCDDCILYCCAKYYIYNTEIPIANIEEIEKKGILLEQIIL